MTIPLLTTKLYIPPPQPNLVARPRLVERLEQGLHLGHKLSLISAPAGYGKTTLLSAWWAAGRDGDRTLAWLSLDRGDDGPLRFFTYFVAALERVGVEIDAELGQALAAGQLPPQDVLIATLVNDLARIKTACLVALDDFQWIQDRQILAVLEGLLTHRPPQLHLVLITREDPALPLARWRARNQLTEIRAADLRFRENEVAQFLKGSIDLDLSNKDLAQLTERTEGWAAGLQLAALAMKSPLSPEGGEDPAAFVKSLSGSHRFILSYLTDEVLKRQPPEVQTFLLQTSILSQLNGALCDAVTGRQESATLLESFLAANLFLVPLDDEGHWYRYHHLFAELLGAQLRRTEPEETSELHSRASRWFETEGMAAEAIEHAIAAGDFDRLIELLEAHLWRLLNQGHVRRIEAWIEGIPGERRVHSPRVSLDLAWMYLLRGNFEMVVPHWQQAATALEGMPEETALQAESLALEANLMQAQGKIAEALEAGRRALELIDPDDVRVAGLASLALGGAHRQAADFDAALEALQRAIQASQAAGDSVTTMLAVSHLTLMCLQHGRLRLADETASQALAWLDHSAAAPPPIAGSVYGALGRIYYEWNQIGKARDHLQRGIRLGTFTGHNASIIYAKVNLAQLLQTEGDCAGAEETLDEAATLFQQGAPGWVRPDLIAQRVELLAAQDQLEEAEAMLRQSGVTVGAKVTHRTDALHLAWLRLLSTQGAAEANQLARRIVASAEAGQRHGTLLRALVLGALLPAEDVETRRDWLARAVSIAEPAGYVRTFVDEGPSLAAALRQLDRSDYVAHLLDQFALEPAPAAAGDLVEPLTERELEVLRLLEEGLTYAETADRLVVSINTVRYHIKEIYGKLGVSRRAHAVERAQELGYL